MTRTLLLLLVSLLLAACGGTAAAPASNDAAAGAPAAAPAASPLISPDELAAALQTPDAPFLLDVREPWEHEEAAIPGTDALIPLGQLAQRVNELDPDAAIVVYCRSDNRSGQAQALLQDAGFTNVRNLEGGIINWAASQPTQ